MAQQAQANATTAAPQAQGPAPQRPAAPAPMSSGEEAMLLAGKTGYQQQSAAVRPGAYGDSPTSPNRRGIATYQRNQAIADKTNEINSFRPQVEAAQAAVMAAEQAIASSPLLDLATELAADQILEHLGDLGDVVAKIQAAKEMVEHVTTLLDAEAGEEAHAAAVKGLVMQVVDEIPVMSTIVGTLDKTLEVAGALDKKAQAQQQLASLQAHAAAVSGKLRQLDLELGKLEGRSGMHFSIRA